MKPTLKTPNTLHLHQYRNPATGTSLILACYVNEAGELITLNGWFKGKPWEALATAIGVTRKVGALQVLVVSNDSEVVDSIAPALRLNLNVTGEPEAHHLAIWRLSLWYGGHCSAMHADKMPKTEAAWQQHYQ